jgi:hypothetical protein
MYASTLIAGGGRVELNPPAETAKEDAKMEDGCCWNHCVGGSGGGGGCVLLAADGVVATGRVFSEMAVVGGARDGPSKEVGARESPAVTRVMVVLLGRLLFGSSTQSAPGGGVVDGRGCCGGFEAAGEAQRDDSGLPLLALAASVVRRLTLTPSPRAGHSSEPEVAGGATLPPSGGVPGRSADAVLVGLLSLERPAPCADDAAGKRVYVSSSKR